MEEGSKVDQADSSLSLIAAINRYERYERLRDKYSDDPHGFFDGPLKQSEQLVMDYLSMPGVNELVRKTIADTQDEVSAGGTPGIVNRLADFMSSKGLLATVEEPAIEESPQPTDTTEPIDDPKAAADSFLSRGPDKVSADLFGKYLSVGNKSVVITDVVPQHPAINQRYLKRPIFGHDRNDAFVSSYRGHSLLFFRAGDSDHTDCCVYVKGVSYNGTEYPTPSKVGQILELPADTVGDLELKDDTFVLKNIRPNPRTTK